jgi:periplasmic protein TonB
MIALAIQERRELRRWLLCGTFVLGAHVAVLAAGVLVLRESPDDGDYGSDAIVLELTPEQEQGTPTLDKPIEKPVEEQVAPLPEEQSEVTLPAKPPDPEPMPKPADNAQDLVTRAQQDARRLAGVNRWDSEIAKLLEHNKRYPAEARARGEQGVAELAFSIDRQGRVLSSRIVKSSGVSALDDETLALVQRAQPFPVPPPEVSGAEIKFTVPVRFNIH